MSLMMLKRRLFWNLMQQFPRCHGKTSPATNSVYPRRRTTSNLTKYANAESERAAAERLVEESKRLSLETEKKN
ncbi:hypothetical protein DPMN_174517 [Dreissena polymorpha]|uniref:Uncharacterized protein n=1 Tax=Dreissena polymorpha TaxID=45954 RepID=A0A9D4E7L3_DREPO|nr:hypothetical protein DPMN_174517 [Dreissena polymorpha]